jgi:hypothetical protein
MVEARGWEVHGGEENYRRGKRTEEGEGTLFLIHLC